MAVSVLKDAKIYIGGYDLSGDHNKLALAYEADAVDVTPFGASTKKRICGLFDSGLELEGFWDADALNQKPDPVYFSKLALADVFSVCPDGASSGALAYSMQSALASYSPQGKIGDVFAFKVKASGSGTLVRETVFENRTTTATGTGTGYNLGAVSSGQALWAAIHVLGVSGTSPTLDVVIESDDSSGFTTPLTRLAFTQKTGIGAEMISVAGPITDTWFRAKWTIGGTSPSFTFIVVVGIK